MGLSLDDVIARSTWNPAREIKQDGLGHLSVGAVADVAVLRLERGRFGLVDMYGARMDATAAPDLRADGARRQGAVYDLNGLSRPDWRSLPADYRQTGDARWDGINPVPSCKEIDDGEVESESVPEECAGRGGRGGGRGPGERARSGRDADKPVKKVYYASGKKPEKTPEPLFNGVVMYGNMVFISGIGAHFEGDIKAHTKHVLDEIQKRLESVGSSMEKVLKVNVYLNDLKDYDGMNEMFRGRFGPEPGVRTTIAAAGGIPGNSLVEIDCIAYI